MSELDFYESIAKSFNDDAPTGGVATMPGAKGSGTEGGWEGAAQSANLIKAITFGEAMFKSYADSYKRQDLMRGIKSYVSNVMKLGTSDIGFLLITSISPRFSYLRNEETPILNLTEMATGPDLMVDDWAYRVAERRQGLGRKASRMNPEGSISTGSVSSLRSQITNTLMFWGDPVSVEFIASAQAGQQRGIDLLRQEMDSETLAIRKAINFDLWNGVEQRSFAPQNTPCMGGLIERIHTNTAGLGGLGLADASIETGNDDISKYAGYSVQKVIYCSPTNVGSVRSVEINRYGGNNPVAFMEVNRELATNFAQYKLQYDRIFEPNIGPAIPVIHDLDLPANVAVMLTINPDYVPRMAYFRIGGAIGPWFFVRPVYDLKETVFCMNGGTMDDPMEELRKAWSNTL